MKLELSYIEVENLLYCLGVSILESEQVISILEENKEENIDGLILMQKELKEKLELQIKLGGFKKDYLGLQGNING